MAGPARASKPSLRVSASRVPSRANVCDGGPEAGHARADMKCASFQRRGTTSAQFCCDPFVRDKYVGVVSSAGRVPRMCPTRACNAETSGSDRIHGGRKFNSRSVESKH